MIFDQKRDLTAVSFFVVVVVVVSMHTCSKRHRVSLISQLCTRDKQSANNRPPVCINSAFSLPPLYLDPLARVCAVPFVCSTITSESAFFLRCNTRALLLLIVRVGAEVRIPPESNVLSSFAKMRFCSYDMRHKSRRPI